MKKSWIATLAAGGALLALTLAGCHGQRREAAGQLRVVATIFPGYDFARAVAGDRARVDLLVPAGTEIHSFELSPRDVLKIKNADVFIYIGGESEAWVEKLLGAAELSGKTVVRLMDHVRTLKEDAPEDEPAAADADDEADEHIWTSPKNAAALVLAVAAALEQRDAANAEFYKERAARYAAELADIDRALAELVARAARRKIVVADRFPFKYLADAYGLEYCAAFTGCATATDVAPATLARLIQTVRTEKLPCVYQIELSSGKIAATVSGETGVEILTLHSAQNVSKEEFARGVTVAELMRLNVSALARGLGDAGASK